jgi:hypothetical protein
MDVDFNDSDVELLNQSEQATSIHAKWRAAG